MSLYTEIQPKELADKLLSRQHHTNPELYVKYKPVGTCLSKEFTALYDTIRNFHVRPDDVFVCSVPKSGTTWAQEMVWLLGNNLDYERAKKTLKVRFPFLEFSGGAMNTTQAVSKIHHTGLDALINLPSPRYIMSHLHLQLLPTGLETVKPKIVYVARNPKDVCVSLYHHKVLFAGYLGTLEDFVEEFLIDFYVCAPYWPHVREFWNRRNESHVFFLKYEDMINDLPTAVKKTAEFLGKTITVPELNKLVKHLSFESMKTNEAVNNDEFTDRLVEEHGVERKTHFIRKGKVGGYKEELSAESITKLDAWIAQNNTDGIWDDV